MENLTNLITAIIQNSVNKSETMTFSKFFDLLDKEFNNINTCLDREGSEFLSKAWVLFGHEFIDPAEITKENIDHIQNTFDWMQLDLKRHK